MISHAVIEGNFAAMAEWRMPQIMGAGDRLKERMFGKVPEGWMAGQIMDELFG
ncbi:hypothetical protein M527_23595 [Sphingobium indicum IP26]|nr:hypothetical protein M527_23595 [Sphingobium indicum IP26]